MQTLVSQPGCTELYHGYATPRLMPSFSEPEGAEWSDTYYFPPTQPPTREYGLGYYGTGGPTGMSWADWCLEHFCCCCLEPDLLTPALPPQPPTQGRSGALQSGSEQRRMPFVRPNLQHDPGGTGALSQEVYAKIREVDNQTSTLTHAGSRGLSARILDKIEYHEYLPDGSPETFVCQTVEVVKRPGQSLGLFLREGNAIERADGVFVSRLAPDSELHAYPDVIRPLDEILTVNNVDVRHMAIDDVVVIMSIPRRLILRLRFIKSRRQLATSDLPASNSHAQRSKPVVVVKGGGESAMQREDSRESAFTDDNGGPGPTPTARTSLGIKAREQLEEIQRATGLIPGSGPPPAFATLPRGRLPDPRRHPQHLPHHQQHQQPLPGLTPRHQYALHGPRLLDSEPPAVELDGFEPIPFCSGQPVPEDQPGPAFPGLSLPPEPPPAPLRRPVPPHQLRYGAGHFSPRSIASDTLADYAASFSQPPPLPPKPALRQPDLGDPYGPMGGHKSNSLPRGLTGRRPGPRVKWKNDIEAGRSTPLSILQAQHRFPDHLAHSDSEAGAYSAPEFSPGGGAREREQYSYFPPTSHTAQFPMMPPPPAWGNEMPGEGEVYSAAEYNAWADEGRSRPLRPGEAAKLRSSSLPPRAILADLPLPPSQRFSLPPASAAFPDQAYPYSSQPSTSSALSLYANLAYPSQAGPPAERSTLARLDVSPLLNRRGASLRPAGPGWNVDDLAPQPSTSQQPPVSVTSAVVSSTQPPTFPLGPTQHSTFPAPNGDVLPYHTGLLTAMTGLLIVHILEGRGLKVSDRQKEMAEEVYCVLEVDGEHRARTGVSNWSNRFTWNETFEMEVMEARQMDVYIYSWHPQLRHKLCHRGSLKLMEAFVIDKLNGERRFALTLEPRGQLLIRINFLPLSVVFRRSLSLRRAAYFGVDLRQLVQREQSGLEVPVALKRLVDEIERRGLDSPGLYLLCGAAEKKRELRYRLERSPLGADLSTDTQPDTNVLSSVMRDFLRELPEPPVPPCVFQMLTEANRVCLPNDQEGNARLMLGIIDCLPKSEKCLVLLVMDHLAAVGSQSPHNGMSYAKLGDVFGPLLFSTAQPRLQIPPEIAAAAAASGIGARSSRLMNPTNMKAADFLDVRLAADVLTALLMLWPGRTNSSGSENSTLNLTQNGVLPLMDVWLAEHRLPESDI